MPPATSRQATEAAQTPSASSRTAGKALARPFLGMIDPVLVDDPADYPFPGSIGRKQAQAIWIWVARDLCGDIIDMDRVERSVMDVSEIEPLMPQIMTRMREAVAEAGSKIEAARRIRTQLGGDEAYERLPVMLNALRCRALLIKAQGFGKAANTIPDEAALGVALQSMPLQDPQVAALLLHAAVGQVVNPSRLVAAVVRLVGNGDEAAIVRSGFGPLIDALLAHAQSNICALQPIGPFADIDLICRSLDRFHKLIRAVTGYVSVQRGSRWGTVLGALTKRISERIEPRLRDVVPNINQSLRKGREGADRLDTDQLLAALNGIYLLGTIRDCRDSLALNAVFEQAWNQSGEALEMHIGRNLDALRLNPDDKLTGTRLDFGIKMAEIRFNPEYAETLKRARTAAERRS
ncbi:hypothetical protein [Devosia sp.]|uniref:hypothetical protein n=1 Tax=Devosia sp. TaxID=1871048 RepID=UPI003267C489